MPESIVVNGRFLTQPITGVQRYAFELLRSLDRLLAENSLPRVEVTVLVPPGVTVLPEYSFFNVCEVGRLTGQLWEQFDLPRFCVHKLLFTPCGGAPVLHSRHVITIHDAGPFKTPAAYSTAYRVYYKALQKWLARSARILTVSEFSRWELIEVLGLPEHRISRIYESGEHILRFNSAPDVLVKHGLSKGAYALAVSSANPNKNLINLVKASALLADAGIPLAIAGGNNKRIFSNTAYYSDSVRQLGVVSDADLRTLYQNAGCFIFPSLYEGFGLPPMEAMILGCPVVVSRAAALPEVFGAAATYCDPESPEDIAANIIHTMHGDNVNRDTARAYAATFTWERCARETWAVLLDELHKSR